MTSEFIALGTAVGEIVLYNAQNGEFVTRYVSTFIVNGIVYRNTLDPRFFKLNDAETSSEGEKVRMTQMYICIYGYVTNSFTLA